MKSTLVFRIYKTNKAKTDPSDIGQIYVVKQFADDTRVAIGHGAEVQIDLGAEISSIHCVVEKRGSQYFVCDMGSEKGTFKDNRQVLDEPILNGESFQIGSFNIVFFVGAQAPLQKQAAQAPLQKQLNSVVKPVGIRPVVSPMSGAVPPTSGYSKKRSKTFAPKSEFSDLRDYLKVGNGPIVEVIVSWHERILNTYHFSPQGTKTLGVNGDIAIPDGSVPNGWQLLNLDSGVIVNTTSEMKVEILRDGEIKTISNSKYKLQQNEALFIQLGPFQGLSHKSGIHLVVRFAQKSPMVILESPFILGASELTGVLAALIIAVLTSLLVSIKKPKTITNEETGERIAQIFFTNPPSVPVEEELTPKTLEIIKEDEKSAEDKKEAVLLDKTTESQISGNPNMKQKKSKVSDSPGSSANIKPNESKLKAKMFTSTKQGASIKTGSTTGANAQSKEPDLSNSGLLAAFGQGGARTKLDQVYSGSGELIGAGEKAKGASGFNADRRGDDLGSKFKETGAGGSGVATQGIAGVGTKGRSTGMNEYGSGTDFGNKASVQISAGGNEEAFVGSIDREAVKRVIMSALSQFKACYEREYRQNTRLEGKVVVTWEIHDQGVAKNARIIREKSTINNRLVEECVRTRMLGLKFPEPPAGNWAEISFPFIFQGQKY